jgi:D-sedoheptulose 7-phosphate isomerase
MKIEVRSMELLAAAKISDLQKLVANQETFDSEKIVSLAQELHQLFESGQKVAFVGNGGSAAEAMHLAAEFTGKCVLDHRPLPAICLNESQSSLTAIANDYGIEHIFSRQVLAHIKEGDILIALSTSGKSKNILNALEAALKINARAILWMGNFDFSMAGVEVWKVPENSTPRIQEVHLAWGHIVAELVETLTNADIPIMEIK